MAGRKNATFAVTKVRLGEHAQGVHVPLGQARPPDVGGTPPRERVEQHARHHPAHGEQARARRRRGRRLRSRPRSRGRR